MGVFAWQLLFPSNCVTVEEMYVAAAEAVVLQVYVCMCIYVYESSIMRYAYADEHQPKSIYDGIYSGGGGLYHVLKYIRPDYARLKPAHAQELG